MSITTRGGVTPETLLIVKETVEQELLNPCISCVLENSTEDRVLDYCHYQCKKTVETVAL